MKLRIANLGLLVVVIVMMAVNITLQVTIIRQQRKTIDLAEHTIEVWRDRAMTCEGVVMN